MGHVKRPTIYKFYRTFAQRDLIRVIVFIVLLLTLNLLISPHNSNYKPNFEGPNISDVYGPVVAQKPNPKPMSQPTGPILLSWRGPIQPISAPPNVAPVLYKIPTNDPVVFVGIDDGVSRSPEVLKWFSQHRVPFSMFLYNGVIKQDYGYFAKLQAAGMEVENHTLNHPKMSKLNLKDQKAEICGAADTYGLIYGKRPKLFRPPYGDYNDLTRQAAAECGMRAIVMWHATVDGGAMHFQDKLDHLEPGDIILMHFKPDLMQDIDVLAKQLQKDNLQVGRLEDWIK